MHSVCFIYIHKHFSLFIVYFHLWMPEGSLLSRMQHISYVCKYARKDGMQMGKECNENK